VAQQYGKISRSSFILPSSPQRHVPVVGRKPFEQNRQLIASGHGPINLGQIQLTFSEDLFFFYLHAPKNQGTKFLTTF
jgi:hypothetical protein